MGSEEIYQLMPVITKKDCARTIFFRVIFVVCVMLLYNHSECNKYYYWGSLRLRFRRRNDTHHASEYDMGNLVHELLE